MDLSRYRLEALRQEHGLVLYRGSSPETGGNVLVLAPETLDPDSESFRRLEDEYALANELGFDRVIKPLALTRRDGRAMLVLVDPGGLPLTSFVGKPLDLEVALRLAVELVAAHFRAMSELQRLRILQELEGGERNLSAAGK